MDHDLQMVIQMENKNEAYLMYKGPFRGQEKRIHKFVVAQLMLKQSETKSIRQQCYKELIFLVDRSS